MFAMIMLILGTVSAAFNWVVTVVLFGVVLLVNMHPAGFGWLYLALIVLGFAFNRWSLKQSA